MIDRVAFTSFKSLRAVTCELQRFTVIVGANGSGKTSILDGLHYLAQSTRRRLGGVLRSYWSPSALRSRGATGDMALELAGRFGESEAHISLRVVFPDSDAEDASWTATVDREWAGQRDTMEDTPAMSGDRDRTSPPMRSLSRALGAARKLRLDPQKLAAPSYNKAPEEPARLAWDGSGLASVLADMALRTPEVFQDIQEAARKVVPALERIRLRPAKVYPSAEETFERQAPWFPGHQVVLDFKGAPDVLAPLASEGTLLTIGLLTALHAEPQPRLLLLDDVDQALHPRAQGDLVAQIRRVLEERPDLQIVATSHSPYLLDHFSPAEVLLTAIKPDGSTACARLSQHPDLARWQDMAKTGELWSFVGEDWVLALAERGPAA